MKKFLLLIPLAALLVALRPAPVPPRPAAKSAPDYPLLDAVNARNAKIQSLSCTVSGPADGFLFFERENKFRLRVGRDIDLGSNDGWFWVWLRGQKLLYGRRENLPRAGLKTPFNPDWVSSALGLGVAAMNKSSECLDTGKFFGILRPNAGGSYGLTLIDKTKKVVAGVYLYESGRMTACSEASSYVEVGGHVLPSSLLLTWYSEGVRVKLNLSGHRVNEKIAASEWVIPDARDKEEIGK